MSEYTIDQLSRLMRAAKALQAPQTPAARGVTLGTLYRLAHECEAPPHYVRFVLKGIRV